MNPIISDRTAAAIAVPRGGCAYANANDAGCLVGFWRNGSLVRVVKRAALLGKIERSSGLEFCGRVVVRCQVRTMKCGGVGVFLANKLISEEFF